MTDAEVKEFVFRCLTPEPGETYNGMGSGWEKFCVLKVYEAAVRVGNGRQTFGMSMLAWQERIATRIYTYCTDVKR